MSYCKNMGTLREVVAELRTAGAQEYVDRNPFSVLVDQGDPAPDDGWDDDATNVVSAATITRALDELRRGALPLPPSRQLAPDSAVFVLRKRPGGSFPDQIGVGRSRGCDVVLPFASVSKYHASFSQDADGAWSVMDAGSTNGTFFGSERLATREPAVILDGAIVQFGYRAFQFFTAQGLVEWAAFLRV